MKVPDILDQKKDRTLGDSIAWAVRHATFVWLTFIVLLCIGFVLFGTWLEPVAYILHGAAYVIAALEIVMIARGF